MSSQDNITKKKLPKGFCFDFGNGECLRGDACKFSHSLPAIAASVKESASTSKQQVVVDVNVANSAAAHPARLFAHVGPIDKAFNDFGSKTQLIELCREFSDSCTCKYGDSCKFVHVFKAGALYPIPVTASNPNPNPHRPTETTVGASTATAVTTTTAATKSKKAAKRLAAAAVAAVETEATEAEDLSSSAVPTSNRNKKKNKVGKCFAFAKTGSCQLGDECKYRHVVPTAGAAAGAGAGVGVGAVATSN